MLKFSFLFLLILNSISSNPSEDKICQKINCAKECEKLSDGFCDYLWNDQNLGNISLNKEQRILIGRTKDELISYIELNTFLAMIQNKCSFPEEVRKILKVDCKANKKDWFDDFENFLLNRDGLEGRLVRERWRWKLNDFKTRFDRAESLASNQRTLRKFPHLKKKSWNDLMDEEKRYYMEDYFNVKSEVLLATYINHENLNRVRRLFEEVQKDIIFLISSLNLKEEEKVTMIKKVQGITLVLPFEDPRSTGASLACKSISQNAYYLPKKNIFTLCGGYLNGYHVDGHIYRVMAHEISHSIDPHQLARDAYKRTKLSHLLKNVYLNNGNVPCEDWKKLSLTEFFDPSSFWVPPKGLEDINNCLANNKELSDLTIQSLDSPAEIYTSKKIHQYAKSKLFTLLARPKIIKKGKLIENQYFLNPNLLEASRNEYFPESYFEAGYFHIGSVFVQNLRCIEEIEPTKKFNQAILRTEEMFKTYKKTLFSFLGRNDDYLQYHNLANPISEAWADWMAANAMRLKLKRMTDQENKKIFALSTQAKFCGKNGLERLSANHLKIEKNFSKQVHPLIRSRRLSYFLDEFSTSLNCKPGEEIKKLSGSCPNIEFTEK